MRTRTAFRSSLSSIQAFMFLFIMTLTLTTARICSADASQPTRVLVLYWYGKDAPINVRTEKSILGALKLAPGDVEYYPEYLESSRFPGEEQSSALHDYLRRKYAGHRIDVIIALTNVSLEFLLKYRADLFPDTPIVFYTHVLPDLSKQPAVPGFTGVVSPNTFRNTLALALELHPAAGHVYIITGTAEHSGTLERQVRKELTEFESRLPLTYLSDLPVGELITRVKSIPRESIVLYVRHSQDEPGRSLIPTDVLALVAQVSSAPIYGVVSSYIGNGCIGGYTFNVEAGSEKAVELALRIVKGETSQDLPVAEVESIPMFDWRELQRWGINEEQLPVASVVQFKELTFWDQYKWQIAGVLSLCGLQAMLIAALLIERRRRRRVKEELDQTNAELEQRIAVRTSALQAKTRELETFAHSVAHDLKAPLRGIDGYSRLLLEDHIGKLDDEARGFLHTIRASTDQMTQLIDDVLTYSEVERREMRESAIELGPFISALVEERRAELKENGIGFSMNVNGEVVVADAKSLAQALRNYLDNAIKFSSRTEEPRIEIGSSKRETQCLIWVRDNGIGFDMKYHDRIFEIFNRLHQAEKYGGSGVGLAIVRKAIGRLNGRAWAESEPGCGATFFLEVRSATDQARDSREKQ